MKRLYTLIALLGLVGMLAGCDQGKTTDTTTSTNAPAVPSTNAPAAK